MSPMNSEPTYRLLSLESEVERPRVLRTGSLEDCLDELKEVVLFDHLSCNRSVLEIVGTADDRLNTPIVEIVTARTTGEQP